MNTTGNLLVKLCCERCIEPKWIFLIGDIAYGICDNHVNSEQFTLGVTNIIDIETQQMFSPEEFCRRNN